MKSRYWRIFISCILLIALFCVSTVGVAASFSYERYTENEIVSYKRDLIDAQYAEVFDLYGGDGTSKESELFRQKDSLERLKGFNRDLNTYFNFYEVYDQFVEYCSYYYGEAKFVCSYDLGYADQFINQELHNDNNDLYYVTPLEAVQIGLNAMVHFHLADKVESGRCFTSEEYVVTKKLKEIPVLLGYEYEEYHDIGDQLKVLHMGYPVNLKVVGFLKKGSYYPYGSDVISLDRMIVMPSFDFKDKPTGAYAEFQKYHYSEKNWGRIGFNKGDEAKIAETFNALCQKYDLIYQIQFSKDFGKAIKKSQLMVMKETKQKVKILSTLFFSIVSLALAGLIIKNIELNKKRYAVFMICGSSLTRLKMKICGGIAAVYGLGYLLSFILIWRLMSKLMIQPEFLKSLFLPIGSIYAVGFLVLVGIVNWYISKINFSNALRQG